MNGPVRVLHVDDDPAFVDVSAELLEHEADDFDVETVTSPVEALDRVERDAFHCIVSDYDMPRMDGIELLEAVRETHPDLPFVLFTGNGSESVASEAVAAGATDYLRKGGERNQYAMLANRIRNAVEATRSKRGLEMLADAADAAFSVVTTDRSNVLYVNDAIERLYGVTPAEFRADPMARFRNVVPEDADRLREELSTYRTEQTEWPYVTEFRVDHPDRGRRWLRVQVYPVGDSADPDRVAGVTTDVTERTRLRDRLERSRDGLRQIVDTLPQLVFVKDADGRFLLANEATATAYGTTVDELEGSTDDDFADTETEADRFRADDREVLCSGEANHGIREQLTTATGETRCFETDKIPFESVETGEKAVLGVATDVTDVERRQRDLDRQATAMESTMDGIAVLNADGEYTYMNEAHAAVFGYDPEELLGDTWRRLYGQDEIDRLEREVFPELDRTGEWRGETVGRRRDDSPVHQEITLTSLDDGGLVCVNRDITERKERERAIERLHRTAQRLIEAETPTRAAEVAVSAIEDVLGLPLNSVHLFDAEAGHLSPAAWTEAADDRFGTPPTFEKKEGLVWEVFETGAPAQYDDVSTVPGRYNPETEVGGEMILPLGDHGIVLIGSVETDAFDDTDVSLARTLAAHLTTALDRVDYERKLAALNGVAADLVTCTSVEEVCERTVTAAEEVLTFDLSLAAIEEDGVLVPKATAEGISAEEVAPIPVDEGVAGETYRTGESFLIDDVNDHPDVDPKGPFRSLLSVAVGDHGNFQAAARSSDHFDEQSLELAELLASHAATVLDRLERQRALRRQNDRLEEFASVVSHDLRSPIEAANGHVELLARVLEDDNAETAPAVGDRVEGIRDQLDRMTDLVEDLLALARSGDAVRDPMPVSVSTVVETAWSTVETTGAENGTAMIVKEPLPTVRADRSRLTQLFENLFRNARDHGGEDVEVTVGRLSDPDTGTQTGFYVADDGPGIPSEESARVFETGYSTQSGGVGLGLSIVEEVATAHGWNVRVTEGPDGGARFEIVGVNSHER
jgi:PAS domain S-box-containing protein